VTLVLDSGGLTALAGQRARLRELQQRGLWPAQVPAVVLTEALTGDHRRDFHLNRLLHTCQVRPVTEEQAREGARLRTLTGRAGELSAVDAVVAATAGAQDGGIVLTSDPGDLRDLEEHAAHRFVVVPV
jgi:predicted nucleic acid-binding protein